MVFRVFTPQSVRKRTEEAVLDLPDLMVAAEKTVNSILHGEHLLKKSGSGETFRQFREYMPGDEITAIDWKTSAKSDRIYIRQKERRAPQYVVFWCAQYPGMFFKSSISKDSKIDAARIFTLALSILCTRGGEIISLAGQTQKGRSEKTLGLMAERLCEETVEHVPVFYDTSLPEQDFMGADGFYVLVGDFLNIPEEIEQTLKYMNGGGRGGLLVQILDPAEITLPYEGRTIFEFPESETNERHRIENVASIRGEYITRMQSHIQNVRQVASSQGFGYVLHTTDQPIQDGVLQAFNLMNDVGRR